MPGYAWQIVKSVVTVSWRRPTPRKTQIGQAMASLDVNIRIVHSLRGIPIESYIFGQRRICYRPGRKYKDRLYTKRNTKRFLFFPTGVVKVIALSVNIRIVYTAVQRQSGPEWYLVPGMLFGERRL